MTIDERVRDALHAYADPIEPTPGSWDRIEARLDERLPRERRARGPLVLAAVGILVIIGLIGAALVRDLNDDSNVVSDQTAPTTPSTVAQLPNPPQRVLVFGTTSTGGTSMVVLPSASRDGIANMQGVSGVVAGSPVAVTPDGAFAYVVRKSPNSFSTCGGGDAIFKQALGPGVRAGDEIANATAPAVSPDGRYLAYLACKADGDGPWLTLRDLQSGEVQSSFFAIDYDAARLQFSPDSSRLLVASTRQPASAEFEVVNGRLERIGSGAAATSFAAGYWDAGRAFLVLDRRAPSGSVRAVPRAGGTPQALLDGQELDGTITNVIPNLAGNALLVVVDDARLSWWAPGMSAPSTLDQAMLTAAWMPDAAPATSATLPIGIAAVRGNELVVLGPVDGAQHSSFGPVASGTVIAPSADGRTWVLGASDPPDRCDFSASTTPPALERLDTVSERRRTMAGGAYSPVTNRNDVVAYGYACDGNGLGFTALSSGRNFRVDPLPPSPDGPPQVRAVQPLGWSTDGRRLLYLARTRDATRLVVARFAPAFFEGARDSAAESFDVRATPGVRAATMLGDSVVVAWDSDPRVLIDHRDGERLGGPRRLVELPEPVRSIVADPTGQHLLVVTEANELWRWSRGESGPAPVASNVTAAAWIPWS